MDELQAILSECAALRGTPTLEHRVLNDFNWFVNAVIWGGKHVRAITPESPERAARLQELAQEMDHIRDTYKAEYYRLGPGELTRLARAFLHWQVNQEREEVKPSASSAGTGT